MKVGMAPGSLLLCGWGQLGPSVGGDVVGPGFGEVGLGAVPAAEQHDCVAPVVDERVVEARIGGPGGVEVGPGVRGLRVKTYTAPDLVPLTSTPVAPMAAVVP